VVLSIAGDGAHQASGCRIQKLCSHSRGCDASPHISLLSNISFDNPQVLLLRALLEKRFARPKLVRELRRRPWVRTRLWNQNQQHNDQVRQFMYNISSITNK
jgi:hypothetical protein